MRFSWKKPKSSRISRFVADRINSSKQGGNLVVQTGFPTSLIDLYHKNWDRLKKSGKKNRFPAAGQDPAISPVPAPAPESLPGGVILGNCDDQDFDLACLDDCLMDLKNHEEEEEEEGCLMKKKESEDVSVSGNYSDDVNVIVVVGRSNKVFVVVLKILFMVILALVTKRLVRGVSISAFSLFLLEYVGKYLNGILKPVLKPQTLLKMMVERVLSPFFVEKRDVKLMEIGSELIVVSSESEIVDGDRCDFDVPVEEIVDVECDRIVEGVEVNLREEGVVEIGEDWKGDVSEIKGKGSRRAKMRSKMKKLVLKKLCKSKKKGTDLTSEVGSNMSKEEEYEEKECERDSKQFECSGELCDNTRDSVSVTSADPCESLENELEASLVMTKAEKQIAWSLGYWFLCLIVLSGLVGGRILAIVLTLSWCGILRIQKRSIKLPS